jgi:hypothetical protein
VTTDYIDAPLVSVAKSVELAVYNMDGEAFESALALQPVFIKSRYADPSVVNCLALGCGLEYFFKVC